jgi:hypothetical protein
MMTLATGRECNDSDYGIMFDIVAGDRPLLVHALHAQSHPYCSGTVNVTTRTVAGGWEANQGSAQPWRVAGEGQITEGGTQTRLALRRPVRVEAGQRLGVFLHTPDSDSGVGFHCGDASPVQGDGLVIHKGRRTNSATPFEAIISRDRFFAGSVEYELLPAAAAAAPAGGQGGGEGGAGEGAAGGGGGGGGAASAAAAATATTSQALVGPSVAC